MEDAMASRQNFLNSGRVVVFRCIRITVSISRFQLSSDERCSVTRALRAENVLTVEL